LGLVLTRRVRVPGELKRSPAWPVGRVQRTLAVTAAAAAALALALPRDLAAETIESALARAYRGNPQLNAQRAIVRQNDEGVSQALSGYRPTLSATASVGEQYTNETGVFPPIPPGLPNGVTFNVKGVTTQRAVGLNGAQTLFNGEQTANKVRKAESQVSAARETLRMMEESVLLSAASAYMDVSRDTANLEVQQNNIRVLQRTLKDTRNRFAAGQVTATDVAQAEAQLAAGEATLHAAESTLMTTRANFRRIIGVDPANLAAASPVDRLAPTTLNAAVAVGAAENPTVTAALYGVDVAQLQVRIAEGALWPTLAFQGGVQQQVFSNILTPNLVLGTAMLNLSVPIYQGGAEYSAIRLSKETVGQSGSTSTRFATKRTRTSCKPGASSRRRRHRSRRRYAKTTPPNGRLREFAARRKPANARRLTCSMPSRPW